jgi:hypothetical protein
LPKVAGRVLCVPRQEKTASWIIIRLNKLNQSISEVVMAVSSQIPFGGL